MFKYRPGECVFRHCRTEKTPCQAIKTRSSKSRKIEIFPNFNLLFWSKIGHFSTFFEAIQARKMCFTIFQNERTPIEARKMCFSILYNEKTPFQDIKNSHLKSQKIKIFAKGLTHGFGQKLAIFHLFCQVIQARRRCFTIFQNEKTPFQAIKKLKFKKSKN